MERSWSRVYGNGATVVPSEVREALDIDVGDILIWHIDKKTNKVYIEVRKDFISKHRLRGDLRGRWTKKMIRDALENMKRRRRRR